MATTLEGSPYVESSDLVASYPATSLALANRVDLVGVLPFANSTARGTAIPSPTDGQYSYLQDTNSTEFWNGSAWTAAGVTPGLTMITPTSIANSGGTASLSGAEVTYTGVTSISLNGIFSATYQNYAIIFTTTLIGVGNPELRYRAAGTDSAGSNYVEQFIRAINTTVSGLLRTRTAQELAVSGGSNCTYAGDIFAPFDTAPTANFFSCNSEGGIASLTCRNSLSTSFDGLTLFTSAGSFTGKMRVYGYKNS
jgi:hypothetical protein